MVRSLYLKIVGTFIGVVLVSICLSYLLTPYSLDKEKIFKEELSKISIVLAEVIQMSGPENISNLIEEFDDLDFEVLITDGDHIIYKMEGDSSIPIHQADIDEILEHSFDDPVVRVDQNNPSARIIGIPIDVSGEN